MKTIHQKFKVSYSYPVHFTEHIFDKDNIALKSVLATDENIGPREVLFVVDQGVKEKHPKLLSQIRNYVNQHQSLLKLCMEPIVVPGGEEAKNQPDLLEKLLNDINRCGLCRHSYVVAIGGGAVLDLVGYAAAVAHRGIRHIRIPTTVLSQNDSGVGVKNGINLFGKKNFVGTFAPPYAVINDATFLTTLDDRDWRSGIAEAIKVALIKDADFFKTIQLNADKLAKRDMTAIKELIYHCAQLHLEHIASGDPFEMGSSRPLDFGHWASHKLEYLTNYELRHGEAVAIGIALDSTYSYLSGMLTKHKLDEIIDLIQSLGFQLYTPELSQHLDDPENPKSVLSGLKDFREHLGGELTIMLLSDIGEGVEINYMDHERIKEAIQHLKTYQSEPAKC